VIREPRSSSYANWSFAVTLTASDGYRIQRLSFDINDHWSEDDQVGCVAALGLTAASLIKAIEASGVAIYGGDAVEGFVEGYCDEEINLPSGEPRPAKPGGMRDPSEHTNRVVPGDDADSLDVHSRSASHPAA
jgi:hypothetical protein